ncbi:MAG: DUF4364 family protein [Oscillospiraceae bacterium]|nr:DUF4364 family protein [Oscillospiraceae bacterium]
MKNIDNLKAGIPPGGIRDIFTVKVLVCYLLGASPLPLNENQLHQIFDASGMTDYFTLAQTLSELEKSGHIVTGNGDGGEYLLKASGHEAAEELGNILPFSVKEKVLKAAAQIAWTDGQRGEIE